MPFLDVIYLPDLLPAQRSSPLYCDYKIYQQTRYFSNLWAVSLAWVGARWVCHKSWLPQPCAEMNRQEKMMDLFNFPQKKIDLRLPGGFWHQLWAKSTQGEPRERGNPLLRASSHMLLVWLFCWAWPQIWATFRLEGIAWRGRKELEAGIYGWI